MCIVYTYLSVFVCVCVCVYVCVYVCACVCVHIVCMYVMFNVNIFRRRRYTKHDLYTGEVAYTESENVVLNPVAPQPYLGTFQPIPVTEFKNHVNKMHADSDYRFSEEYAVCSRSDNTSCMNH